MDTQINMGSKENTSDHDLIIKVDTKLDALKEDIRILGDGTTLKILDHETRIRNNETNITKISTWGSAVLIMLGLAQFFISKLWH